MEKKKQNAERKRRLLKDRYLDNMELQVWHVTVNRHERERAYACTHKHATCAHTQTQQRKIKEEREEIERARARERQEDTIKNLEKKEFDLEKAKRCGYAHSDPQHLANFLFGQTQHPLLQSRVCSLTYVHPNIQVGRRQAPGPTGDRSDYEGE